MSPSEIAAKALELTPIEQAAYLHEACGGDQALVAKVQALLRGGATPPADAAFDATTSVSDFHEPTSGSFIGPYKLIRQLGEGGMGVVYHAQQMHPIRREVALKIIKPGMDSKQVIARFESERQALALMDHPNIARVFEAGTTPSGRPYFVMERVDGIPITRYSDSNRLSIKERIGLFIAVCQAIQHAHQKGIIHRDIKPSNVLVTQQHGNPAPKVIDFGLAKAMGQDLSDGTMITNFGTVVGTLEYMSPEQADMAHRDIDTRSDVYSLGVLLYELLTGTTPLEHERLAKAAYLEVLQCIREEEPAQPSARLRKSATALETAALRQTDPARLPKLLRGELDWITMRALEKDRGRRYETVNGLARDLQRYLEGEPVEAGPPSTTYRLRKAAGKHRFGLAVAAVITTLIVVGSVVSAWMAVRARRAEAEAKAVSDFLQNDLLANASVSNQARPDTRPDPELTVRTALDRAAVRIEGRFDDQPLVEASIRQTVGSAYRDLAQYPEASQQIQRALELRSRVLGEENSDTLRSASLLAQIYQLQGKYGDAEVIATRTIQTQRNMLGNRHPDTLETMHRLGELYRRLGKYVQAEAVLNEAIEIGRGAVGEEDPLILNCMGELGAVYADQGKYAQAELVLMNVANGWRRLRGEEHPETVLSTNNLAVVYARQGKYTEAEPIIARNLGVRRRLLGEDHQETLRNLDNLAALYAFQKRQSEAEQLYAEALAARRRVLGDEHPDTLFTMNSLAVLYGNEGKPAQAESLFAKVLESRRRVLGESHPLTLSTQVSLGALQVMQRRYAEAEPQIRSALQRYEQTMPESWELSRCRGLLGAILAGQMKFSQAETLLLSSYEGLLQRQATVPARDRPVIAETGQRIVKLYEDSGALEKAAEWRRKLQTIESAVQSK